MSPGKMAAQAGHAFLDTFGVCLKSDPEKCRRYNSDGHGTKVVLEAKDVYQLMYIKEQAEALGIPCSLIVDSGHIMLPHFTGEPIVTALGIGPAVKSDVKFLSRLHLVK